MISESIFDYVISEESRFETDEIQIGNNWRWNFKNHIQMIFHLKNGIFFTGSNNWLRAFKNIMEPLLNLSYWAEDIEVKDVVFSTNSERNRVLSFLLRKYYNEVFVKENNIDTLFDEITESDLDYGGVLVQTTNTKRPEVLYLNTIAFCDQTDILAGPIAFKYNFSPDRLRSMAKLGWGNRENGATATLEELIELASSEKTPDIQNGSKKNLIPGKNIEIYILRGSLPDHYLDDKKGMESYMNQVHILAFYTTKENKKKGVVLYRKQETESTLKFFTSKKIHGRALGRGVGESLLHQQIWTNFLEIHKMNLLESASKIPLYTDDAAYGNRNKIQEMENLEITTIADNKRIYQVPTAAPANIQLLEGSIHSWYEHAQLVGAAFDPLLGKEPPSGTTFRGQNQTIVQGKGLHERRRGQRAKFIEELHRDWIIPYIVKEILNGTQFVVELTADEAQWVSQQLAQNYANKKVIEAILQGEIPQDEEAYKQEYLTEFAKKGNKHLLKILKGEFKDIEIKIDIDISGKQKNLAALSDKILSIFQFVFSNPPAFQQVMQIPGMQKAFDDILEFSGISPVEFSAIAMKTPAPISVPNQQPSASLN